MNYETLRDKDLKAKYLKQSWEPLRITFDFSNMVCSANVKNFIIDQLLKPVSGVFEKMLKVKRNPKGVFV